MTRTRAMLWGALYGAIVGPMMGGLLFMLMLLAIPGTRHMSLLEKIEGALAGAPLGILWFGGPGLLTGPTGALLLHRWLAGFHPSRFARVFPFAIGIVASFLSLTVFRLLAHVYVLQWIFLVPAAIAGGVSFAIFGRQLRHA